MARAEMIEKKVIMQNDVSPFCYFGWPTIARMPDGRLALTASGFRLMHVCPFGKGVLSLSDDEGETWAPVQTVIDTPLDDRDSGITAFGDGRVIFTSFNNTTQFQRLQNVPRLRSADPKEAKKARFIDAYLDYVQETGGAEKFVGSTYRISDDGLRTFGPLRFSPVTCPHGPLALKDGTLLYIGRRFSDDDAFNECERPFIECWKLNDRDEFEYVSAIDNIENQYGTANSCEPHAIETSGGRIIVHIRVQQEREQPLFTVYQSVSEDGGNSFSVPVQLLSDFGGSPAHLTELTDGTLLSLYGYRAEPYGIRWMLSRDEGRTWQTDYVLYDEGESGDLGYPSTVQLKDGTLLTVFYENRGGVSKIYGIRWRLSDETQR